MDFTSTLHNLLIYSKHLLIGIGIGIGLYYAKFTIPFFKWLKGGIENQDGKLENKDLQIALASLTVAFVVFTIFLGSEYPDSVIWGSFSLVAGLYGIKEIYTKKNGKD